LDCVLTVFDPVGRVAVVAAACRVPSVVPLAGSLVSVVPRFFCGAFRQWQWYVTWSKCGLVLCQQCVMST